MAKNTQKDRVLEYLKSGLPLTKHEAFTILNIKKDTGLQNSIAKLRADGYYIETDNGTYIMTNYTKPKVKFVSKQQREYIEARNRLIPEARKFANEQEKLGTDKWTYVFATKMAELANIHLGCKTSWQI